MTPNLSVSNEDQDQVYSGQSQCPVADAQVFREWLCQIMMEKTKILIEEKVESKNELFIIHK